MLCYLSNSLLNIAIHSFIHVGVSTPTYASYQSLAQRLALQFEYNSSFKAIANIDRHGHSQLLNEYVGAHISNRLYGKYKDVDLSVFNLICEKSSNNHDTPARPIHLKNNHIQTAAYIRLESNTIPDFDLRPKTFSN